jgi:6-phosphogluconolactonase
LLSIVKRFLLAPLALLLGAFSSVALAETFYLGTYTEPGGSEGIYRYDLNPETGAVKDLGLAVKTLSPSFLVLHPDKKHLYAVNEAAGGGASAFEIQGDGSLRELNRQSSRGQGATHLSLDRTGKYLLVANYDSGSVAVLPIEADGSLGKATGFVQHKGRGPKSNQEGPHAHSIYADADNRRVFVPDLGLDKVFLYRFDASNGVLSAGEPPAVEIKPGSGPRHLAFGANGLVYVVNEMGNNVVVLAPEGAGFKQVQSISTLPAGFHGGNSTAEIALHPNGRFLYVSNRGHNSIASFSVAADGQLTPLADTPTQGDHPRFFGIHPNGKLMLVANKNTNNVVVFRLNPDTGALTPAGVEFKRPQPVCIVFVR